MKRCLSALIVLAVVALPARAHFLWIVPDQTVAGKPLTAKAIFSDSLEPDANVPVTKVAKTKLFIRTADGKTTEGKWAEGEHAYTIALPDGNTCVVAGVCQYGVFQRGKEEPVLLNYYAKAVVAASGSRPPTDAERQNLLQKGIDKLPLEITVNPEKHVLIVLWKGKPLPDAEVVFITNPKGKDITLKADKEGQVGPPFAVFGLDIRQVGIRVSHTEAKAGTLNGKEYKAVRHYLTLVSAFNDRGEKKEAIKRSASSTRSQIPAKDDPAASKLLAEARAARANWQNFPGFIADLTINIDGKTHQGKLNVTGKGKVTLLADNEGAREWARRELSSLVAHRLDNSTSLDTPCAFLDSNTEHPLGRAIRVLNDEVHSSYRVRDRQIIEVNRVMKGTRFTITVLENRLNEEKKFLPVSYVVNYWDANGMALEKSQSHHDEWTRVGSLDLPTTVLVVTTTGNNVEARSLKLTGHQLSK
jgi:hypothetical protein